MEAKKLLKYGHKVTIVTVDRFDMQSVERSRVRRVESRNDRFWADDTSRPPYALSNEGTSWVRGWDDNTALVQAVAAHNTQRTAELRVAAEREAAARQVEAERQKEETRKRDEKERHEREERTVATMKRAWQLVVDAEVPQDLRETAFQFAIMELTPRGWGPFILPRL